MVRAVPPGRAPSPPACPPTSPSSTRTTREELLHEGAGAPRKATWRDRRRGAMLRRPPCGQVAPPVDRSTATTVACAPPPAPTRCSATSRPRCAGVLARYQRLLADRQSLDFDDLVRWTRGLLLRDDAALADPWGTGSTPSRWTRSRTPTCRYDVVHRLAARYGNSPSSATRPDDLRLAGLRPRRSWRSTGLRTGHDLGHREPPHKRAARRGRPGATSPGEAAVGAPRAAGGGRPGHLPRPRRR